MALSPKTTEHREKNYLAAIHIAQKSLSLSKDDAEALKLQVVGLASAAGMSDAQRRRYLAHLTKLQETAGLRTAMPAAAARPHNQRAPADGADERWAKARTLWTLLAKAGQVHVDTDAALMAYVKRQTHVAHWRFLNSYQVNTVIESLKRWCRRAQIKLAP